MTADTNNLDVQVNVKGAQPESDACQNENLKINVNVKKCCFWMMRGSEETDCSRKTGVRRVEARPEQE